MRTEKPTSQTGLAVQTQIKAGESRDECKTRCNAQDNANYQNGADKSYAAAEFIKCVRACPPV